MTEYVNDKCLGRVCKFYYQQPDSICFHHGVLPRCSPDLKNKRQRLDDAAPCMYEALKEIIEFFERYSGARNNYGNRLDKIEEAVARVDGKAITANKGEEK